MKAYEIKVTKTGGDVVLAESRKEALANWLKLHGKEYLEVSE